MTISHDDGEDDGNLEKREALFANQTENKYKKTEEETDKKRKTKEDTQPLLG